MREISNRREEDPNAVLDLRLDDISNRRQAANTGNLKSYEKMQTQIDQIRYEFTNQDTIVLRKSGMFHKAVSNSAVILKYMGAKTKIRSSIDPATKQEIFELSVHVGNIDKTKEFLKEKCGKVLRDDKDFFIIRLKQPMDTKKLRALKKSDLIKNDATRDILTKKRNETPLAKESKDIFQEAIFLVRTMNGIDGQILGRMIMEAVLFLYQSVRTFMRDEKSKSQLKIVDDAVDDLQGLLLLVPNFTENADRLARIGRSLNRISDRVKT